MRGDSRGPGLWETSAPLTPANAPLRSDLTSKSAVNLSEFFPVFAKTRVMRQWVGMIDVTPDTIPVISNVDALPGRVVATGFSGHGFGSGPAAGRPAAYLATRAPPVVDPYKFRLSRFGDGSNPRPITCI